MGGHVAKGAAIDLTVLGTSSPYPRPGDPCSSLVLRAASTSIWVDAGAGTLGALLAYTRLENLDAVWISHTHADHFSDMAVTYYAMLYADIDRPPLPVYGPPGWSERLRAVLSHGMPSLIERAFDVHELVDGEHISISDLDFWVRAMNHDVPCFGFRAQAQGMTVAYTGDTGPCQALLDLATDVDLLVSEAGYGVTGGETDPVHLTAGEAGAAAAESGARHLALTHFAGGDRNACSEAASQAGARDVVAARPGMSLVVGDGRGWVVQ